MLSKLKAALWRLAGEGAAAPEAAAAAEVEYKGYLIRPTPYKNNGQYQTSGTIRKETPEGMKELGSRQLQPGMPAEVVIKTGGRSLLTYLAAPLSKRMAGSMKEE